MNVLIACEQFGVVRDAFLKRGHNAVSCDLEETRVDGPHYRGDVRDLLCPHFWDLIIAHPDCTYLTCSAEWAYGDGPYHQKVKPDTLVGEARREARREALEFVRLLASVKCERIAIENPAIGAINKNLDLVQYGFRTNFPTQIIHPHQFGHDASKQTGLALKGLPDLVPTLHIEPRIVDGKPRWSNQTDSGQNRLSPGADRAMQRAKTYQGWADAMAEQWGSPDTSD